MNGESELGAKYLWICLQGEAAWQVRDRGKSICHGVEVVLHRKWVEVLKPNPFLVRPDFVLRHWTAFQYCFGNFWFQSEDKEIALLVSLRTYKFLHWKSLLSLRIGRLNQNDFFSSFGRFGVGTSTTLGNKIHWEIFLHTLPSTTKGMEWREQIQEDKKQLTPACGIYGLQVHHLSFDKSLRLAKPRTWVLQIGNCGR